MTFLGFLILLIVAALCGSIGAGLAGFTNKGCLTSIILGLIGALIGTWLSRILHIPDFLYLQRIPVFWSIAGAAVFVALLNLLGGKRSKRH
jgi:uncharacterized membrane protein YeaQ/YmgE (transglycosylase-associated protein family)